MTKIGLIRHGLTEWNYLGRAQGISDIPLNEQGIQQAVKIGERLANEEWDIIISSNLLRAKETAKIIGSRMRLPITVDQRIREIDCGEIEGTTEDERVIRWGKAWREADLGMEKFETVAQRGIGFLEDVAIRYEGKSILIVSHGALIGLTLQHLLPEKFPTTHIDNTSISILQYHEKEWNCQLYNCTKHL